MNRKKKSAPFVSRALCLGFLLCGTLSAAHAERIWWDGSRDSENAPPGKLLSDNGGYWGQSVPTGVTYTYDALPESPGDVLPNSEIFGKRLLNGVPAGDWYHPVGTVNRPIVPTFDFKRVCTFSEVDISTRSNRVALKIEVADLEAGPWRVVYDRPLDQSPDKMFQRVPLTAKPTDVKPSGRYLRLTVNAVSPPTNTYSTFLEEVIVWGDAPATAAVSAVVQPVAPTPIITGASATSITGAGQTAFSDSEFKKWQSDIGASARRPAVWSLVPTWDSISNKPLLPTTAAINEPVAIVMARNEAEYAALALTNTSLQSPKTDKVTLSAFEKVGGVSGAKTTGAPTVRGRVRVGGVMVSREHGTNIGPLLSPDNMPGDSLLRRHVTNAGEIKYFPYLSLKPAGSAVLWLQVTTANAAPGIYQARLSFGPKSVVTVRVEVLDVTLPKPFVWLQTWSGGDGTGMFPFTYGDRLGREVDYKQSLGVTVWNELPTPGSGAALARKRGRTFHQPFIVPYYYVNGGYNGILKPENLTAKDEVAIAEHVRAVVKQTQDLGLTYDDWAGEIWDEPSHGSAAIFGAVARLVRKADPKVRIYSNPVYWAGNGYFSDEIVSEDLSPWFREFVDVSVPNEGLLRPKSYGLFDGPHFIRAFYGVSTRGAKSERSGLVEYYRWQAWNSISRGWNGWGFYSYYAPRGNPWNDFDTGEPDYQMVYPGPRGPIPTRQSEAVRQGWEDYRLMALLKKQNRTGEIAAILKAREGGESMEKLRLRALRAAAIPQPAQR